MNNEKKILVRLSIACFLLGAILIATTASDILVAWLKF